MEDVTRVIARVLALIDQIPGKDARVVPVDNPSEVVLVQDDGSRIVLVGRLQTAVGVKLLHYGGTAAIYRLHVPLDPTIGVLQVQTGL